MDAISNGELRPPIARSTKNKGYYSRTIIMDCLFFSSGVREVRGWVTFRSNWPMSLGLIPVMRPTQPYGRMGGRWRYGCMAVHEPCGFCSAAWPHRKSVRSLSRPCAMGAHGVLTVRPSAKGRTGIPHVENKIISKMTFICHYTAVKWRIHAESMQNLCIFSNLALRYKLNARNHLFWCMLNVIT